MVYSRYVIKFDQGRQEEFIEANNKVINLNDVPNQHEASGSLKTRSTKQRKSDMAKLIKKDGVASLSPEVSSNPTFQVIIYIYNSHISHHNPSSRLVRAPLAWDLAPVAPRSQPPLTCHVTARQPRARTNHAPVTRRCLAHMPSPRYPRSPRSMRRSRAEATSATPPPSRGWG